MSYLSLIEVREITSLRKKGVSTSCISGFKECYTILYGSNIDYKEDPIYNYLVEFDIKGMRAEDNTNELRSYDYVIAEYLYNASLSIDQEYYKKLLKLLILYREILKKSKRLKYAELTYKSFYNVIAEKSNKVLLKYVKLDFEEFDVIEAASIIIDFNSWLYSKEYSSSRVQITRYSNIA